MLKNLPIYLDCAATTPVDPRVAEKMITCLTSEHGFGNASSRTHRYGEHAREWIAAARQQVADLLRAEPDEILWTSGATESVNLAIKGAAYQYQSRGKHIITCKTEHKAVLDTCASLEKAGFSITYLTPESSGLLDVNKLVAAIRKDTVLISIMHVNNEIGVIQDIEAIANIARDRGILFHTDASQSVGKIPIDLRQLPIDLLSCSAHKIYGPKGVGALYVRSKPKVRLVAQMHGGMQEQRMRAGTLATHQIVGMGAAFHLAKQEMAADEARIRILRDNLWAGIQPNNNIFLNGDECARISNILNVSFADVDDRVLQPIFQDLAVSQGSACNSTVLESSYVLRAIGRDERMARYAIRFSLGRFTTKAEIDRAIKVVRDALCYNIA